MKARRAERGVPGRVDGVPWPELKACETVAAEVMPVPGIPSPFRRVEEGAPLVVRGGRAHAIKRPGL